MKKKFCVALSVIACLFACIAIRLPISKDKVTTASAAVAKDSVYTSTTVKMLEKASIRRNSQDHGIRFATFIGNDVVLEDLYGEGYELGTLFIPAPALTSDDELTVGAKFGPNKDILPAVAIYDGSKGLDYPHSSLNLQGRLFNAVLDLSDLNETQQQNYLTTTIVARSYVKKADGSVIYLGTARRSPATVAAKAILAGDDAEFLNDYVSGVKVSGETLTYNVGTAAQADFNITNAEGFPVTSYTVNGVTTDTFEQVPGYYEGVTAKVNVGGVSLSKTVNVNVIGGAYTFKNNYYIPDGELTYTVYGVNEVKVNGNPLNASDYTLSGNTVKVKKSAVAALKSEKLEVNELEFVSATNGTATVDITTYTAELTDFEEGDLGVEILGETEHIGTPYVEDGYLQIPADKASATAAEADVRIRLNADYMKAMFAYPNLNTLQLSIRATEIASGQESQMEGRIQYLVGGTIIGNINRTNVNRTSRAKEWGNPTFTRAMYNSTINAPANYATIADNFYLGLSYKGLTDNTIFQIEAITVVRGDGGQTEAERVMANRLYADAQLVTERGLPIETSTMGGLEKFKYSTDGSTLQETNTGAELSGSDVSVDNPNVSKENGSNVAVFKHGLINMGVRKINAVNAETGELVSDSLKIRSALSEEIFYFETNPMIDNSQYVNITKNKSGTHLYPFTLAEGEVLKYIALNGVELPLSSFNATNGGITVDKAMLEHGHNALLVRVERTGQYYSEKYDTTKAYTAVDIYYRSICGVTDTDLHSAMTFENGMNPFLSVIGADVSVVDSYEILGNSYYKNNHVYTDSTTGENVANEKVLKVTKKSGRVTRLYVATSYIVARREAVVAAGATDGAALCAKIYAVYAEGSSAMGWESYTPDEGTSYGGDSALVASSITSATGNRPLFTTDIYPALYDGENILQEYMVIRIDSSNVDKVGYFDDIFGATTAIYHLAGHNVYSLIGRY